MIEPISPKPAEPKTPDAKPPDLESLWQNWRAAPSPEANARMLRAMDPILDKAIQTHVGAVNPLYKGRARRMALSALGSYDPTRGKLQTHLYNQLQGLKRYAARTAAPLSVPERLVLDRRRLEASRQELADNLGRDPSDDELADHAGLSLERIRRVRGLKPAMREGTLAAVGMGGLRPAVSGDSTAWLNLIYSDLPPMDQKVFEWTLGWNGHPRLSNQEIAKRLRRSPGLISQRKLLIQKMIDQELELSPFGV